MFSRLLTMPLIPQKTCYLHGLRFDDGVCTNQHVFQQRKQHKWKGILKVVCVCVCKYVSVNYNNSKINNRPTH